jgi:hypothetical protein
MKIGLVLFGHLRSYKQTLTSFQQLINQLQQSGKVDVFCHSWDIEESVTASWWKEHKTDDPPPATINAEEIKEKYQPVRFIIEPSKEFDDTAYKINSSVSIAGILSMLHSQRRAFELLVNYEKESGFRYDVVIKTRYDLLYEIAPVFSVQVNECIARNCVYLPSSNPYELAGSSSDIFALGSRREMEKYFSFCNNFKMAADAYFNDGYCQLIPELCMSAYLNKTGVKKEELTGLRLHILRMNGEKFQINSDKNFSANGPLCFYRGTIGLNKRILPEQTEIIAKNSAHLVKKYMSWLNDEADQETLRQYADFYQGRWIGTARISRLAAKGEYNLMFTPNVMKNFFEMAIRNSGYGFFKKVLLTSVLLFYRGYGFFFFRIWKNIIIGKI